jgi:hypothetical protein
MIRYTNYHVRHYLDSKSGSELRTWQVKFPGENWDNL